MLGLLGSILPTVNNIVNKVVPDKNAAAAAQIELARLAAQGDLDNMAGQLQANVEAAKSPHLFVAGARPAMIWLCGVILAFNFLVQPLVLWTAFFFNVEGLDTFPRLDDDMIVHIVLGLLGLGGMRSFEKARGTAREGLK